MAPRIPKRNTHFIHPEAESSRGRSALEAMRGYVGAPSQASVMYPGTQRGYEAGELAGMEKAVRHVDAINKWRAAQQGVADQELANKAMVIREYAENNPKGLRWMELGPEKEVDEALIQVGRDGGAKVELPGEEVRYFNSPEEAKKHIIERRLEKQLKYEGDSMGHCVGGYCPDVLRGRSRIFSLRDAKGEPHVTVEVGSGLKPNIKQVKGKQNLAPKEEYLPFVQDFVRNSPLGGGWGRVGDLKNTGLRKVGDRYVTLDELKDVQKTPDGLPIGYEPLDDLPEWAEGGLVAQPDYFDDLDAFLRR